jgi:hypothetical protein
MTAAELLEGIACAAPEELPAVLAAVAARMAATARAAADLPAAPPPRGADRWIDAAEAAAIAGVSVKVMYDWARVQAWAVRPSRRCLRIDERSFRRWLASRS